MNTLLSLLLTVTPANLPANFCQELSIELDWAVNVELLTEKQAGEILSRCWNYEQ